MNIYYLLLYFFVYGFIGWCAEVGFAAVKQHCFVNRGFLNGPICPIYGVGVTAVIAALTPFKSNILLLYVLSVILVTTLEGITGWAMDKIFHNKWWDYTGMPFNIGGYVCLAFSLVWGVACVIIMLFVQPLVHKLLTFLPHTLGIILLVILSITLFADLYVTASAIFKFNRQLEGMKKIAAEMHEISDQIGQDIFERTIRAMEFQENITERSQEISEELRQHIGERSQEISEELRQHIGERSQEISEELRQHIGELRQRYAELGLKQSRISHRLINAFPKMESRKYKEQLNELKKKLRRQ